MMDTMRSTFEAHAEASPLAVTDLGSLNDLSADFADAIDRAIWAFELQGELEEALDYALFRVALAGTPTLSGGFLISTAA